MVCPYICQRYHIITSALALVPTATFPTQLKQAVLALQRLISMGVDPQNIQITGDSAGANLVLQLFSHILHPFPGVPRVELSAPLRGAYLMSPWMSFTVQTASAITNGVSDAIGDGVIASWGSHVLAGIPESQRPYLEAVKAPDTWFEKIGTVVDRILITGGDAERLRDDIITFNTQICRHHGDVQFILQKYGVHNDPQFDFMTKEKKLGELTPLIVEWFTNGFD